MLISDHLLTSHQNMVGYNFCWFVKFVKQTNIIQDDSNTPLRVQEVNILKSETGRVVYTMVTLHFASDHRLHSIPLNDPVVFWIENYYSTKDSMIWMENWWEARVPYAEFPSDSPQYSNVFMTTFLGYLLDVEQVGQGTLFLQRSCYLLGRRLTNFACSRLKLLGYMIRLIVIIWRYQIS